MAGNSQRRGAVRKAGKNSGSGAGTGGKNRRSLEGKGPTPKATERTGHPAARRAAAAQRPAPGVDDATTVLPVLPPDAVATRAHERATPAEPVRPQQQARPPQAPRAQEPAAPGPVHVPDDATRELSLADELFSMSPDELEDEDQVDEAGEGRSHGWFAR